MVHDTTISNWFILLLAAQMNVLFREDLASKISKDGY